MQSQFVPKAYNFVLNESANYVRNFYEKKSILCNYLSHIEVNRLGYVLF